MKLSYKENNINLVRKFVVKISVYDENGEIDTEGTGFFIDVNTVITAKHVLYNVIEGKMEVKILYGNSEYKAYIKDYDIHGDVILLYTEEKVIENDFSEFPKITNDFFIISNFTFSSFGYPSLKPNGHIQKGEITEENVLKNGNEISVSLENGKLKNYYGFSGSPILCNNQIIGIAIEQEGGLSQVYSIKVLRLDKFKKYIGLKYFCKDTFLEEILSKMKIESKKRIDQNKKDKKYIPDIFVELGYIKEYLRGFSDPLLFFNKHMEFFKKHKFNNFNSYLKRYGLKKIKSIDYSEQVTFDKLKDEIEKVIEKLNEILNYIGILKDRPKIKKEVPEEYLNLFDLSYFNISLKFSALEEEMEKKKKFFQSLKCDQLLLSEDAGQGKTNLLCDFTENVLFKRDIPCLFLETRKLEKNDIYKTISYITDLEIPCKDILEIIDCSASKINKKFVFVLDAINEMEINDSNKRKLYSFLNLAKQYENIRVLITARTEYFDEKFSDFKDECPQVMIIKNYKKEEDYKYNSKNPKYKHRIYKGYLDFFNIEIKNIEKEIYEELTNDFLLMRFFSDTNSGKKGNPTNIPSLQHIYRYEIFEEYEKHIINHLTEQDKQNGVIDNKSIYTKLLNDITKYMIGKKQFNNIERSEIIGEIENKLLVKLIDEDVIFREDIKKKKGLVERKIEVINFTFDEFRDFFIANYIVENFNERNTEKSEILIKELTNKKYPVAEGVQKYLFFLSKKCKNNVFTIIIEEQDWYTFVFMNNIFSVEDKYITKNDINILIKIISNPAFLERNIRVLPELFVKFIRKYNTNIYKTLNIKTLIDIFEKISKDDFEKYIHPVFKPGFNKWEKNFISINKLVENFQSGMHENFYNEVVIFFAYINYRGVYVNDFFNWLLENYSEEFISLLKSKLTNENKTIVESFKIVVRRLYLEDDNKLNERLKKLKKSYGFKLNGYKHIKDIL